MQFINPSQLPAADPDALLPPIELREYLFVVFRHWRVVAVMVLWPRWFPLVPACLAPKHIPLWQQLR